MNGPSSWSIFLESWPLFRDSVLAGGIAGGLLGLVGVYVVLRRMVFLAAAMSQCASLGVAVAFLVQIHVAAVAAIASPTVGATAFSVAVVCLLMLDRTADAARRDRTLGVAFLVGAAGTLVVGTRIVQEVTDIESILFGTAVAVLPEDLRTLALAAVAIVALHLWWRRGFIAIALDPVDARVRRIPVAIVETVLLVSVAVAISLTTEVLGALPAFAFSILPATFAVRVAPNVNAALVVAAIVGAFCGVAGYYLAFVWDLPVGATQTLVGVAFALLALPGRR